MNERVWGAVDDYFGGHLSAGTDPVLEKALQRSREAGLPEIQVSPLQGRFLWLLARATGARSVLEVGSLGGYSTIWLARALPAVGRLITLESDAHHADVARANLAAAGLQSQVEVRLGDAAESLRAIAASGAGSFDLVFLDANKDAYDTYLELALPLTHPGSVIVADNVVRGGSVVDGQDPSSGGVRRFIDLIERSPRLEATAVQTVGAKGYDGFVMALVTK